ncbi:hypothetical protein OIU77_022234 [Salix suchowensis]|uniref:DUF538 family protein n=1 Tax=Salix suchowensis TaxID=1278906 RepID=A0ABQ9C198_9ROSI|nr:hypothetical protein OIU77_022234 [Salix suchowensis]
MASFNILALSLYLLSLHILSKTRLCLSLTTSDIHDLLPQYGLPRGLLPDNVESFTLPSSDGSFEVKLKTTCYVHFDDVVYYDKVIKGKMSYGSVHEVSGIQAKKLFVWLPVTGIEVSKADEGMVSFFVGPISEELPAKQFEDVPVCKRKFQPPVDAIAVSLMPMKFFNNLRRFPVLVAGSSRPNLPMNCLLTLNIEALQLNLYL